MGRSEPEVADFDPAMSVQEQVHRLQVAMDDALHDVFRRGSKSVHSTDGVTVNPFTLKSVQSFKFNVH